MFKFEKLAVWQKALRFSDLIYSKSARFPADERFGLTNQVRRAAVSIPSNIAEGCARSDPDFSRFVGIAAGSVYEVVTQAFIGQRQGFLPETDFAEIYESAEEISRMLSGLRTTLN